MTTGATWHLIGATTPDDDLSNVRIVASRIFRRLEADTPSANWFMYPDLSEIRSISFGISIKVFTVSSCQPAKYYVKIYKKDLQAGRDNLIAWPCYSLDHPDITGDVAEKVDRIICEQVIDG